jgi:ornithine carbamoyltransferase
MKHFINFDDFSIESLNTIINKAIELKKQHKDGVINDILKNKTITMVFDKQSTRTRISFEAGLAQLGGHALFLLSENIQLGRGESIKDSAIVISSMVDCVVMRLSSHQDINNFAYNSTVPIINALSDDSHPCQLLADMMTYKEHCGSIKNKTVAWVGDGNNMCNTYMQAAKIFDFKLNIATPYICRPKDKFIAKYAKYIDIKENAIEACKDADLVVTDTWFSMGQEHAKNKIHFKNFTVDSNLMLHAKSNAVFMHCLPAHRGNEVTDEVIDGKQSLVWDEAENRLHSQKALLLFLMNKL